jgi:hypothetical protein
MTGTTQFVYPSHSISCRLVIVCYWPSCSHVFAALCSGHGYQPDTEAEVLLRTAWEANASRRGVVGELLMYP